MSCRDLVLDVAIEIQRGACVLPILKRFVPRNVHSGHCFGLRELKAGADGRSDQYRIAYRSAVAGKIQPTVQR